MQIKITPEYLASQGLSPTFPDRFWAKVNKNGPVPSHKSDLGRCWIWTAKLHHDGYGESVTPRPEHKRLLAHRACWILTFGPIPGGLCVCHQCDNPPCVNPAHLTLWTHQENMEDRDSKGRSGAALRQGENQGLSKLLSSQVLEIRKLRQSGQTLEAISGAYGVSIQCVWAIVKRQTWRHL